MTLLKGGISTSGGAGALGGGFDPMTMAISAAKAETDKKKEGIKNSFGDFAKGMQMNALAASDYTPNFTPIAGTYIAPQQMQTQQSVMPNLYDYLVR